MSLWSQVTKQLLDVIGIRAAEEILGLRGVPFESLL